MKLSVWLRVILGDILLALVDFLLLTVLFQGDEAAYGQPLHRSSYQHSSLSDDTIYGGYIVLNATASFNFHKIGYTVSQ